MPRRRTPPFRCFKARWQKRGGHIHVDVFVANHPAQTFANCGTLVMSEQDFEAFQAQFEKAIFQEKINAVS